MNKILHFTRDRLEYKFSITEAAYKIIINRAAVNSLRAVRIDQIGPQLNKLNPFLYISFTSMGGSNCNEAPISLDAFFGPRSNRPIIDLRREYPSRDNLEHPGFHDYDTCIVSLTYTPQDDTELDITVDCDIYGLQLYK